MSADPLFFANAVAGAACWVSYRLTFFSMSNELSPGVLVTDASTADIIVMSNTSFADKEIIILPDISISLSPGSVRVMTLSGILVPPLRMARMISVEFDIPTFRE